jgi:iron complex transport system ATP-binding protein
VIDLAHLGVELSGKRLVEDVSLSCGSGEWLALVGPNGAGKTTLLRAVACLLTFTGTVRLDGRDASELRRRELARLIAYVPQHPRFPTDMTVVDYAMLGRTPHVRPLRVPTGADRGVCHSVLARLDLTKLAERTLATLSGGERQRLVLARALTQQAPVLLLDEPTSARDLGRRIDALELVDELRAELGLTVVSVVHDLTLASQFVHALALMHEGHLVAMGTPTQVLLAETLSRVYDTTVRVLDDQGQSVVTSRRRAASVMERLR